MPLDSLLAGINRLLLLASLIITQIHPPATFFSLELFSLFFLIFSLFFVVFTKLYQKCYCSLNILDSRIKRSYISYFMLTSKV